MSHRSHPNERSDLAAQVERYRRLAKDISDPGTVQELLTPSPGIASSGDTILYNDYVSSG